MGSSHPVPLDETLGHSDQLRQRNGADGGPSSRLLELVVLLVAALIFLGCSVSPPSLMDDVDAVQAQIARNMLDSGDWVSARLNGIAYLEKAPLKYWMVAVSYALFGVHDWVARLPIALSAILLCWVTFRFGQWAVSPRVGFYAGLSLASCIGLFLFTRILIPDVVLTLTITLALWSFLRALDEQEPQPGRWALLMAASIGVGFLLKGLIAGVFPIAAALLYLGFSGQWKQRRTWQRLQPLTGTLVVLAITLPWVVLATLRNPPYFDFTMKSEPGHYHGFFWFFFFNEHLFRFLNMRHPRDYNTVPRWLFWVFHLLWLFPWSAYLPGLWKLRFQPVDRAGRTRLLALCWTGFLLVFFTFSTTQEYYSMPCYPALALLLGCAMASEDRWTRIGTRVVGAVAALAAVAIVLIWWQVRDLPTPGDISHALTQHPEAYTLSLGHMGDLTLSSFAYLRGPLLLAGLAFTIGAVGAFRRFRGQLAPSLAFAVMMVLFFHAARLALVTFDPYLGSRPLAEALLRQPPGQVVVDDQYYTFSSVFFYAHDRMTEPRPLLLRGRVNNLEYGSYAPGAPDVFLTDPELLSVWSRPETVYLLAEGPQRERLSRLVGADALHVVAASGGKFLFANHAPVR